MPKIQTAIWFLKRPQLYKHVWRTACGRLIKRRHTVAPTDVEYESWCRDVADSIAVALGKLGFENEVLNPRDIYKDVFDEAEARVKASGVSMGGAASLSLIHSLCHYLKPSVVLETGVAFGWSSLSVLCAIPFDAILYSGDLAYPRRDAEDCVGHAVPEHLRENWRLYKIPDRDFLPKMKSRGIRCQIAHYDSDKSYAGRLYGYQAMWDLLDSGGLLISDDIDRNRAMKDFADSRECELVVVDEPGGRLTGIIRKPPS